MVPLQGPLQSRAADESDTFLVRGSESAEAKRDDRRELPRRQRERGGDRLLPRRRDHSARPRRIVDDARRDLRARRTIPSLKLVGTPYGLGCGQTDPLDLSPGGPGLLTSSDASVASSTALMTDDSTPDGRGGRRRRSARSSRGPAGDKTGLRAYVTGEVGFEADRSEAVKSDRRHAAAGHLQRAGPAAARDLPLAAGGARAAARRRASPTSSPAASPTCWSRPA